MEQIPKIKIGDREIGPGEPVFVIAEIGVNHNGSVETAKRLIDEAVNAGADAVKFQKRHLDAVYQKKVISHPELYEQSFQYLIPLLKEFELSEENYRELAAYAKNKGVIFLASAFDEPSVDFLSQFSMPVYKVASADLVNFPLLERLVRENTPLILSTGMSTWDEIDAAVKFLKEKAARFALLHCQSTYPAPIDSLNLSVIPELAKRYGVPVGYSGHELGTHHTLTAVALGACVVERHITLDKNLPGPDHCASLEPSEFKELVSRIREHETSYGKPTKALSRGEVLNRLSLRKSLIASRDIKEGETITRAMVAAKGPGSGLSPHRLYALVGRKARRNILEDDLFLESDLYPTPELPGELPVFKSKWGLKARFFEIERLASFQPRPALLEFHVSHDDLSYPWDTGKKYPQELYIHAPEYWQRQVVDLASLDDGVREQSIRVMQETIDRTREIAKSFQGVPKIIIHVGGMSITPIEDRASLLRRAEDAFRSLDASGVEILPENLPAFGWFFSGLWHCNVFGAADEMVDFCRRLGYKMCLDLSHAWLYCSHAGVDYGEYLKKVAPLVGHIHVADGSGAHKEGLQIGEGDIPFDETFRILEENLPKDRVVSWVPEIWQGHLHDYHDFKMAMKRLAKHPFLLKGKA